MSGSWSDVRDSCRSSSPGAVTTAAAGGSRRCEQDNCDLPTIVHAHRRLCHLTPSPDLTISFFSCWTLFPGSKMCFCLCKQTRLVLYLTWLRVLEKRYWNGAFFLPKLKLKRNRPKLIFPLINYKALNWYSSNNYHLRLICMAFKHKYECLVSNKRESVLRKLFNVIILLIQYIFTALSIHRVPNNEYFWRDIQYSYTSWVNWFVPIPKSFCYFQICIDQ